METVVNCYTEEEKSRRENQESWSEPGRISKDDRKAFVTTNNEEPYASFVIDGFRTMNEARSFDFWPFLFGTGRPNTRKDGSVVSIPVRDMGTLRYYKRIGKRDISAVQLLLDLFG